MGFPYPEFTREYGTNVRYAACEPILGHPKRGRILRLSAIKVESCREVKVISMLVAIRMLVRALHSPEDPCSQS